ncbi:MAG: cytochrome P450 [Actinomycetales bacterium]
MARAFPRIRRDPLGFLGDLAREHGPVVHLPIPGRPVLLVTGVDDTARVLQGNARNYTKATLQYTSLAAVTGNGLLVSDGDLWRQRRRFLQPAFHRATLENVAAHAAAAAGDLARGWRAQTVASAPARSVTVDMDAAMMHAALDVVGRSLLGADLRGEAQRLIGAVLEALDVVVARARLPLPIPEAVPTPGNRKLRRSLRVIDAAVSSVIARRAGGPAREDLVGLLLGGDGDSDGGLDPTAVRDEIVTMIVAGHETVASALTWTWQLLAEHPGVQEDVAHEARSVLGDRAAVLEDFSQLPLTRQVLEEALRLYPPAWVISRRALDADTLGGYDVPAGSMVILSPYLVHHDTGTWEDAEAFVPQRFSDARSGQPVDAPRAAYLPFGAGPRLCIGRDFALVEATLILASLARSWRVSLPPEADGPRGAGQSPRVDALVTLRPHGGLPLLLSERGG